MVRHALSAEWGWFSCPILASAESERLWSSHMRTQLAWGCVFQGALFGSQQMMQHIFCCTSRILVSAQARCLSSYAPFTNRAQAAACQCIPSCCFACEPRGRERLWATRKARSCDGAKRAAGLQENMPVSCLWSGPMCGMQAWCTWHQHTHVVDLGFFFWFDCLFGFLLVLLSFLSLSLSHTHTLSLSFIIYLSIFSLLFLFLSPFLFFLASSSRRSRLLIPSHLLNSHAFFVFNFILRPYIH
jgi:hypothetical protein